MYMSMIVSPKMVILSLSLSLSLLFILFFFFWGEKNCQFDFFFSMGNCLFDFEIYKDISYCLEYELEVNLFLLYLTIE